MRWLVLVGLLAGCKKKVDAPMGPQPPRSIEHPDLQCADGLIGAGNPPPAGTEVYCARWSPDGSLTKHGAYISWHTPNRRASKGDYLEGKRNGSWVFWHATGSPEKQGSYVLDKMDGDWEFFHTDGTPSARGGYVAGKEHGEWTYWNDDSTRRTEGRWREGLKEGTWVTYNQDDVPVSEANYSNGRQTSQRMLSVGQ